MKQKLFIGLDIGGTKLAAALVTERGKILCRTKRPTPPQARPHLILTEVRLLLKDLLAQAHIHKNSLAGIGIGVPGLVDTQGKKILRTPNIHLARFPLVAELKKSFSCPVILGNDVNVGLLGEHWLGAGKSFQQIIGIFVGTGVGGGIIVDGKIFTGGQGLAGEIGHMTLSTKGPLCHCGNRGCLEALTSRWAIERDIRKAIKSGKKSKIKEIAGGRLTTIKSKILKKALLRHDPLVTRVLHDVAQNLGLACISLKHLFNPELIILGGGVIEACGDFVLPIVRKTVSQDPFFKKIDSGKIVNAKLKDDAGILGAAALVRSQILPTRKRSPAQKPR